MSEQNTTAADNIKVKNIPNIGEVTVGGTSDVNRVILLALATLNDPLINEVLLAFQVKFSDRFTKTPIFPRNGMALPNDQVYVSTGEVETIALPDDLNSENV